MEILSNEGNPYDLQHYILLREATATAIVPLCGASVDAFIDRSTTYWKGRGVWEYANALQG